MVKKITLLTVMGIISLHAVAQVKLGNGQISGSLESNSAYYIADKQLRFNPKDRFGSNNYLKLDYNIGKFSAGILAEGYFPAMVGFYNLNGTKLTSKYVQWQDRNFSFLVGNIYEQFGSGLIFRTFEDRVLGFNNSLEGVRATYNFGSYVKLKGLYGRTTEYVADASSWVRGADISVSLSDIIGWSQGTVSLEGSYVNRYENLDGTVAGVPSADMYSTRFNFDYEGVSAKFEYVNKRDDVKKGDNMEPRKGNAFLAELGYSHKGFSAQGTFRKISYMEIPGSSQSIRSTHNIINYIPALTRQYTYMLASMNPHIVNTKGEIGAQIDVYYSLRNKETRSKYWNFHINFSNFYATKDINKERHMQWMDINLDIERQWNKSLKTSILFSRQEKNPNQGAYPGTFISNIFVADVLYKFNKKHSIRVEAQYLLDGNEYRNEGDWMAALIEYNFSPSWSFFISNMYNMEVFIIKLIIITVV